MTAPFILMGLCSYKLVKTLYYDHAIFKGLLWTLPIIFISNMPRNLKSNLRMMTRKIYLYENGTKVDIENCYGEVLCYDIKNLRKPTLAEL